jgi:uncharacterized protein
MTASTASVVAVSVSTPRWHEMFGRRVFSSIVREPAAGPVCFGLGGPEGNETAVHTEEVFAFFGEHYDYWASRLGVDRGAWGDCHWGENLMLQGGLREDSLHIGDRFRVGEALLEVTSPRIPCFKLSWRLGQSEAFLRELIASGLMGCYFRVIEPGWIAAGDAVARVAHAADALSVMALSKLLHDPAINDVGVLRRVLVTPGLGSQASEMLRKRISALTDGKLPERGRWQGWRRFRVEEVRQEAHGIKSIRMRPVDGGPIGGYRAGQFVPVRLPEDAGGHVRTWSLSDYDQDAESYRLSIKREPHGLASGFVHDHMAAGTVLDVRPPSGRFVLDRGSFLRTVMISAGIGVTPLLAMLKAHAERGPEAPPLLWLHSTRNGDTHAFKSEVDAALTRIPAAVRRVFYTAPSTQDVEGSDYDQKGRIDAQVIFSLLRESYRLKPFGRELELTGDNADFYLCGPKEFEATVRATLASAGVNPAFVRAESFSPVRQEADALVTPDLATVHFSVSGKVALWSRDDDQTLLELAEAQGLRIESGCRLGVCGTCEVGLAAGEVGYASRPSAEPGKGRVLLCCARPLSQSVTLEA